MNMKQKLARAQALVSGAEAEGRKMTEAEKAEVASIKSDIEIAGGIEALGKGLGGGDAGTQYTSRKSLGQQFTEHPSVKALFDTKANSGQFQLPAIEMDYTIGTKANESVSGGIVPGPLDTWVPGVTEIRKQPNTLLSVIPGNAASGNRVRYVKETTATNSADAVAELGTYAQSVLIHADAEVEVEKIGTYVITSDEIMQDLPEARRYFDMRMGAFVEYEVEDQVLNGNGSTPALDGLFTQTTQAQALAGDTLPDALFKAGNQVRTGSFLEPTHVVMHPTDFASFSLLKDGMDNYMGEKAFMGLKPIVTTRAAQGTALVGAFGNPLAVELRQNGGLNVQVSNSEASFFISGKLAVRADVRAALVVYRPAGFCELTGIPA